MNSTDSLHRRITSIADSIRFGGLPQELELNRQIWLLQARYQRNAWLAGLKGWDLPQESKPVARVAESISRREITCAYCGTIVLMTRVRCESCGAPRRA